MRNEKIIPNCFCFASKEKVVQQYKIESNAMVDDNANSICQHALVQRQRFPDVSDSKLWQMFKQTFAPQWNCQTVNTVIAPYESCGIKSVAKKSLDKKFYPSNERDDLELFEQYLAAQKDFCSNVDAVKIFEDDNYEISTAPQNVINRLSVAQKKSTATDFRPRGKKFNQIDDLSRILDRDYSGVFFRDGL